MTKRKKIIIFSILLVIIYCGLYYYKIIRYSYYDSAHQFGSNDNYIFNKYHDKKGAYPNSEEDLRKFIQNNSELFEGNVMAEYLVTYEFHIKYDKSNQIFYVYENGPNYRNDNFSEESNSTNTNLFNYLFRNGDVLLFYFNLKPHSSESFIDKNIELPKNVKIDIVDSMKN